jgi:hypothetical protein
MEETKEVAKEETKTEMKKNIRVRHLVFSYNRELLHFIVKENKEVFYTDRKWAAFIRILPAPDDLIRKIANSRNRIPSSITQLFNYTDEEKKEYEAAKDMDDISKIIIRDCRMRGLQLIKNEEVKE